MQPNDLSMRKRTQIAKANRMMFVWVAGVSVVVGFALVGSIFLAQKLLFNEKVIAKKEETVSILKANNANISELEAQVRVLDSNQALTDAKAKPDDRAIQVILDALPSEANSLALGASLQSRLLAGIDGLTVQSLQVDPVIGLEQLASDTVVETISTTGVSSNQITFRFAVSGAPDVLKTVLDRLERSIRAIDIISLRIESQGADQVLSVEARAFYEPAVVVELKDELVKP